MEVSEHVCTIGSLVQTHCLSMARSWHPQTDFTLSQDPPIPAHRGLIRPSASHGAFTEKHFGNANTVTTALDGDRPWLCFLQSCPLTFCRCFRDVKALVNQLVFDVIAIQRRCIKKCIQIFWLLSKTKNRCCVIVFIGLFNWVLSFLCECNLLKVTRISLRFQKKTAN